MKQRMTLMPGLRVVLAILVEKIVTLIDNDLHALDANLSMLRYLLTWTIGKIVNLPLVIFAYVAAHLQGHPAESKHQDRKNSFTCRV